MENVRYYVKYKVGHAFRFSFLGCDYEWFNSEAERDIWLAAMDQQYGKELHIEEMGDDADTLAIIAAFKRDPGCPANPYKAQSTDEALMRPSRRF